MNSAGSVPEFCVFLSNSCGPTVHSSRLAVDGHRECPDYKQSSREISHSDRNVDLYHWSSGKFSSTWYDTLSVLVAKGRAQVAVAAANGDWSKRIRDMQYTDHEDYTVGS